MHEGVLERKRFSSETDFEEAVRTFKPILISIALTK